jgi:hypothetical protein
MPRKVELPPTIEVVYVRGPAEEEAYIDALRLIAGWIREDTLRADHSVVQSASSWHPDSQPLLVDEPTSSR